MFNDFHKSLKLKDLLNMLYLQFHHILVPPSADPRGHWNRCKLNPEACRSDQISVLHGSIYIL